MPKPPEAGRTSIWGGPQVDSEVIRTAVVSAWSTALNIRSSTGRPT